MTEKEFRVLLKIEGRRLRVDRYDYPLDTVWYAYVTVVDRAHDNDFWLAYPIEQAPNTRYKAVQKVIRMYYHD